MDPSPASETPSEKNGPPTSPSAGDAHKNGAYKLFLVGCWLHVLVGAGHLGFAHFPFLIHEATGSEALVHQGMKLLQPVPGTAHTLFDFYVGNSFSVGVMHLAFGAQCLLAGRLLRRATNRLSAGLVLVPTLASWISVISALLYFPPPPIALLGIASSCFTLCLVSTLRIGRA